MLKPNTLNWSRVRVTPLSKDIIWQNWRRAITNLQRRIAIACPTKETDGLHFSPNMQPALRAWHLEWRDYLFEERERGLAAYDAHQTRLRHRRNKRRRRHENYRGGNR